MRVTDTEYELLERGGLAAVGNYDEVLTAGRRAAQATTGRR
jgi:hypothetical protein